MRQKDKILNLLITICLNLSYFKEKKNKLKLFSLFIDNSKPTS